MIVLLHDTIYSLYDIMNAAPYGLKPYEYGMISYLAYRAAATVTHVSYCYSINISYEMFSVLEKAPIRSGLLEP